MVIPSQEHSRLPAFLAGLVIVTMLIAGAVLLSRYSTPAGSDAVKPLPMGPAEQAYAQQIKFLDPKMSRAANFLNQEVTFVFGTIENGGTRKIRQIEITLEFRDAFNQVVLRETQRPFPPNAPPLAPGQRRDFEVGFESIPALWNNVYPSIRVTGLDLD
jgi:hypothetical protein